MKEPLEGNKPFLINWIVKYDEEFQMPQFVQGKIIGDNSSAKHRNGSTVIINNVESIDLKNKELKTYNGSSIQLVGAGKRMFILSDDEIMELMSFQEDNKF